MPWAILDPGRMPAGGGAGDLDPSGFQRVQAENGPEHLRPARAR